MDVDVHVIQRHVHPRLIYITRAPCIGGWAGGGEGGGQKNLKTQQTWTGGCPFAKMERAKREESTMDRMAILPMAAMPTKKHGTLVRPRNHPPSSHSRR